MCRPDGDYDMAEGVIKSIIGPVVNVEFKKGELPPINNALKIEDSGVSLTLEAHQHIGDNMVSSLDG